MARTLLQEERALLEALLAQPFPGRDDLRVQLDHVEVTDWSCRCGCPSIALRVDRVAPQAAAGPGSVVDGFGRDWEGNLVGVDLLLDAEGYMEELEFYSPDGAGRPYRPTLGSFKVARWSEVDEHGASRLLNEP